MVNWSWKIRHTKGKGQKAIELTAIAAEKAKILASAGPDSGMTPEKAQHDAVKACGLSEYESPDLETPDDVQNAIAVGAIPLDDARCLKMYLSGIDLLFNKLGIVRKGRVSIVGKVNAMDLDLVNQACAAAKVNGTKLVDEMAKLGLKL